jgi:hypothetical protein
LSLRARATRLLVIAAVPAIMVASAAPALATAPQKYTCTGGTDPATGQPYTRSGLTAAQAKKLQERYPGLVTCTAE